MLHKIEVPVRWEHFSWNFASCSSARAECRLKHMILNSCAWVLGNCTYIFSTHMYTNIHIYFYVYTHTYIRIYTHTAYSIEHTVYSMQYAIYSMQYAVYSYIYIYVNSMQYTLYIIHDTWYMIQYVVCNIQYAVCSIVIYIYMYIYVYSICYLHLLPRIQYTLYRTHFHIHMLKDKGMRYLWIRCCFRASWDLWRWIRDTGIQSIMSSNDASYNNFFGAINHGNLRDPLMPPPQEIRHCQGIINHHHPLIIPFARGVALGGFPQIPMN